MKAPGPVVDDLDRGSGQANPLRSRRCGRATSHAAEGDNRDGMATLFVALEVARARLPRPAPNRHRHGEFVRFLERQREQPTGEMRPWSTRAEDPWHGFRGRSSTVRDLDVLGGGKRRGRAAVVAAVAAVVLGLARVPEARAHEFTLVLLSAPLAREDATGRDVIDGFRLGVEESPDVSHPPGEEAGDHLGGVDVEVKVIEATDGPVSGVTDAVVAGASVVVVLGSSSETAAAVAESLAGTGVLVVDAGPEPPSAPPGSPGLLRLHDAGSGPGDAGSPAAVRFTAAFDRRFGRSATEWAARGYDSARLLDVSLRQLGADARDVGAMAAAANASGDLVRSRVVAVGPGSSAAPAPARSPRAPTSFPFGLAVVLGGAAALGALVVAYRLRHRSTG